VHDTMHKVWYFSGAPPLSKRMTTSTIYVLRGGETRAGTHLGAAPLVSVAAVGSALGSVVCSVGTGGGVGSAMPAARKE
jgi:hypothetical protein